MLRCLALLAVLAGCEDKQLARLETVRSEVCACKTPACAEAAMAKLPKEDIRSDHRTQAIAREMLDCVSKVNEAAKPPEDADADPSAVPGPAPGPASGSATRP